MNIAVCVKQIPDQSVPGKLDPVTHNLVRDGKLILDDSDSYGVEMALQLVDRAGGGEVTLISMAPNSEVSGLRTALAMGAAKAVLVSDPSLAGSDALTTAKVLAAAISRNPFDLVMAATESTDGYTGTVPVQVAEVLDIPSVSFAKKVDVEDGVLKVQRQTESGYDEVECPLPALVSVTAGVVEPRYPSFKGIMAAKSKPVEILDVAGLGIGPLTVGQEIVSVRAAEERASGTVVVDEGDGYLKIVEFLESIKVI
jgi:electron transfer flavoprotein beta subunit